MRRLRDNILDELLVVRAKRGERMAATLLAKRWNAALYRHARHLTDSADLANDALQDAWVSILRNLRTLNDPARFGPWAYRIVTHKCTDQLRRRQVRRRRSSSMTEDVPAEPSRARQRQEHEENVEPLRRALRQVPPEQRALLALVYFEQLSLHEVAQALDLPVGTVKSRLHAARTELRALLEDGARS